jgi:signal peptidase I
MVLILTLLLWLNLQLPGSISMHTATGESMAPTIHTGDFLFADNSYYEKNPIKRFDIILTNSPHSNENAINPPPKTTKFVMRVIGLGNETLEIKAGKILINGKVLREPFKRIPPDEDFGPIHIPEGEYFLMGDNRLDSLDSRYWSPATVKREHVRAKIIRIEHKE